MNTSFYRLIQEEIKEKFKTSNIVIWYDYNNDFKQEFDLFDEEGVNKIAYEGSFIELHHKILLQDSELMKKWLIYSNTKNIQGFLTEYEYFGDVYTASVKNILEKEYKIDFGKFDISTLEDRLNILKRLWDIIPESTVTYLDQETLDDIVLTNGFGYVDISKEYTVLKYICETDKYEAILDEAKIKDKFFEFVYLEYGINVTPFSSSREIVDNIVENLFQSELIQKCRNKNIRPFNTELSNPNKIINCVQLLEIWANHEVYRKWFVEYSKKVSEKHIISILNTIDLEELFSIEYLYGIEEILYKKLEIEIVQGKEDPKYIKESLVAYLEGTLIKEEEEQHSYGKKGIDVDALKNKLKDVKVFVDVRKRYYFSKVNIFNKWNVLNNIFKILDSLYMFEEQFKMISGAMDDLIELYEINNWWKIDQLYRKVQEEYSLIDDFITKLLRLVDTKYHYQYLKPLNEEVSSAIENKSDYEFKTSIQLDFWSKYVASSDKQTAVLIVDALRYEMGKEIYSMIDEVKNKSLTPLISAIPSVTEFGMASLLPNGNARIRVKADNDSVKIIDGNFNMPLNNKAERIKYFLEQSGDRGCIKSLSDIVDAPTNNLKNEFKSKDRILIFSSEIDEAGHIEDSSIQMFPGLLNKIQSSIKKLVQIGFPRIVVVADHGFILTSGLEEWMKVDLSKDMDNIVKKRRYSISKKKIEGNYITKTCYSANHDGEVYFNFPRGINVFPASGGTKFYHGGLSIQELVVPVILIEKPVEEFVSSTPVHVEQINFAHLGLDKIEQSAKPKEIPQTIKHQIQQYIQNENLKKKERKILELFIKASSYTDSEIQEICAAEGIRFIAQSVMKFMEDFINKLNNQGYDWIGFRVIGMSTYEYFLK